MSSKNVGRIMRFEIFTAVKTWIVIVWFVSSCSLVGSYNVWEEPASSYLRTENFCSEDGGNRFLQNFGNNRQKTRSCNTQDPISKKDATIIHAAKIRFLIATELNHAEQKCEYEGRFKYRGALTSSP
jgi:hypothetical protein